MYLKISDRLSERTSQGHYIFRIICPNGQVRQIGATSEDDMMQWIEAIRNCSNKAAVSCISPGFCSSMADGFRRR
jgi:ferredoxin